MKHRYTINLPALGSRRQFFTPFIFAGIVVSIIAFVVLSFPPPNDNSELQPPTPLNFTFMVLALLFLIPPLFALQELWKGSNPSHLLEGDTWKKGKTSLTVFSWWLCTLLLPVFVLLPVLPNSFEGELSEAWFFLTVGISIAYWLMGTAIILRVNYRQGKKFRAWAKSRAPR